MENFSIAFGEGNKQIEAVLVWAGNDLVVTIGGGTHHHTGAVAIACWHPKIRKPEVMESTVSVLTVQGHKEGELARELAFMLAEGLQTTVTVNIGIHIDHANAEDILTLSHNTHQLVHSIIHDITINKRMLPSQKA